MIAKKPGVLDRKPTREQLETMRRINAIARRHVQEGSRIVDEFLAERQQDGWSD